MILSTSTIFLCTISLLSCLLQCNYCAATAARDTITSTTPLISGTGETITSSGNIFQLGFFMGNGGSSYTHTHTHIGIWYSMDKETLVWVANRNLSVPVNSTYHNNARFSVEEDGNLKLLDRAGRSSYFSTRLNSSVTSPPYSRTARLLDNGNLVLIDDQSGKTLWQSFDNPTDTFLPGMKMDDNLTLTSWSSGKVDPAEGSYSFKQDQEGDKGYIIMKSFKLDEMGKNGDYVTVKTKRIYWKSGGEFNPNKMYESAALLLSTLDKPKNVTPYTYTRLVMDSSGEIQYLSWDDNGPNNGWVVEWYEPRGPCSFYNTCGDFGRCGVSHTNDSSCNCLSGFEPTSLDNWKARHFYLGGCSRNSSNILCGKHPEKDVFLNLKVIKIGNPNLPVFKGESEEDCRVKCLGNCRCQAYLYMNVGRDSRNGCWIWTMNLTNIQEGNTHDAYNLFFRVAGGGSHRKTKTPSLLILLLIPTTVLVGIALVCIISYISYRRMVTKRQVSTQANAPIFIESRRRAEDLIDQHQLTEDDEEGIDVPFFSLENILTATDNFSEAKKLGQGGFGPVYKGMFAGKEIAVKRLSSHSGQGLEEFKNEVVLIAKLQHRNLVRLLGYCTKGDEKILLYEYMPNRSLDAFIFDRTLCMLLDWGKRFDIILGVVRGLLYLHQDSRLRVIHRDMKASNILLDEEMNPKISDFGLARIVAGRETEANTNRVVGTLGYMSPEYVIDGQFSVKSDVFSFGVVVLEIISGKRNTGFYKSQLARNLLEYAWRLWKEEKTLGLLDQTLEESCNGSDVLKCIIIGLLCVQEDPADRPSMSNVLFMLGSETATLPNPKEPAFISRNPLPITSSSSSSTKPETLSQNELTFSIEGSR